MAEQEQRAFPRAKVKWRVLVKVNDKVMEGVTKDISPGGVYVCCATPLRLNQVLDIVIKAPNKSIEAKAEVVWSNIYGPDDAINPRGMGVRFLEISGKDRQVIAKEVSQHLKSEEAVDALSIEILPTMVIDQEE
jgi:c-di-GMP-binding flagellar brake protein YcgR